MTLRKQLKYWLYGSCPGFAGAFPYYGVKIHFPKGSILFRAACEQGVFEAENVRLLQSLVRPDAVFFDIGAHIGLMSAPILAHEPRCRVVAFEPSPNVLPYLERTIAESPHGDRWTLVPKAVGAKAGKVTFTLSDKVNGAYDGMKATNRVNSVRQVEVELTTIDETWRGLGSPRVCLIKCDVEGAELDVLRGARECLTKERPPMLLEWNRQNLAAYDCPPRAILEVARELDYRLFAVPGFVEVRTERELDLHMVETESFLLSQP